MSQKYMLGLFGFFCVCVCFETVETTATSQEFLVFIINTINTEVWTVVFFFSRISETCCMPTCNINCFCQKKLLLHCSCPPHPPPPLPRHNGPGLYCPPAPICLRTPPPFPFHPPPPQLSISAFSRRFMTEITFVVHMRHLGIYVLVLVLQLDRSI